MRTLNLPGLNGAPFQPSTPSHPLKQTERDVLAEQMIEVIMEKVQEKEWARIPLCQLSTAAISLGRYTPSSHSQLDDLE